MINSEKSIMMLTKTLEKIKDKSVYIEIFGLGYVGFPLAIRLASVGLKVVGIDTNSQRIERLKNNHLMDSELHLQNEFFEFRKKYLELTEEPTDSTNSKIGIICVPTPITTQNINSNVYVKSAVESFLNHSKKGDVIILESSIEVGTTEKIKDVIESKGYKVGKDFGLCFCPERVDPANKEWGIENIPRVIYCSDDNSFAIAKKIYQHVNKANLIRVSSPKVAEVVKSFENAFRLVNISLVNELAMLCDRLGVNVNDVIDAAATKPFSFMKHYPGAGAGGHCIPKDPRFLLESAKKFNTRFETIENAIKINDFMPRYICDSIESRLTQMRLKKSVLVCGLAYKANVEDMRDSPSFKIISEMKARSFTVFGYDPFFKMEFIDKYLIENNLSEFNCEMKENLEDESLNEISCICIVQHHSVIENRLKQIYDNSLVPLIYDCQSKLIKNPKSKTCLDFLGE